MIIIAGLFLLMHTMPKAWRSLNTDFPNYYMAARLVRDGYDTSRMYEWEWIQREKDHRGLSIRVIGMVPITPVSTLAIYPLAGLPPLTAKRIYILFNLALLIPIVWMMRCMTGLSYRRITLVVLLSFPLHRNLLYGQFYVLLLALIVAACFSYQRGWRIIAGSLLAIAAVCKVFPVLLFVFFLQKRDWRALLSGLASGFIAVAASIAIFGWSVHRTWLFEILPWVTRGEGLGTYDATDSITGLLHRLFLSEPQWNPHPWHESPFLYAVLASTIPMLLLARVLWLLHKDESCMQQSLMEWSALLVVALTISTIPASYNFALMIFPVCVLLSVLQKRRRNDLTIILLLAYAVIGAPVSPAMHLLHSARIFLMIAMLLGICALLRDRNIPHKKDWMHYAWMTLIVFAILGGIHRTWRQEMGEREEFPYRLPVRADAFLYAAPQRVGDDIEYSAFTIHGYKLVREGPNESNLLTPVDDPADYLTFATSQNSQLDERSEGAGSNIVELHQPLHVLVADAQSPQITKGTEGLAYIRERAGRGELIYRSTLPDGAEVRLTSPDLNVYEFSLQSSDSYAFSASKNGSVPGIFLTNAVARNRPILADSRYPAISPDGKWLAYSHLEHGVWNLWLRDQSTGQSRRISEVPCNQIEPSWEQDSKTILYGSDCGRSLWFTAIARRKIVP